MQSVDLPENFKQILRDAKKNVSGDWENTFVGDLSERHKKWGDELFISEKQLAILIKIAKGKEEGEDES